VLLSIPKEEIKEHRSKFISRLSAHNVVSGLAPHDEDEYSIVVKGTMITTIGDREYRLSAGDASFIPYGEAHAVYNPGDEICQLIWVLVRRQ
jgi:mannose-6-phosphate isomerase-like protein (cupin superfamily)